MNTLIQLSENDKRAIFALLAVFVFLFLLLGLICSLIIAIMKHQGLAVDRYLYDIKEAGLLDSPKKLKKIAKEKNSILFYLQSRIPLLLLFISSLFYIIYSSITKDWNILSFLQKEDGFASLLYLFDWSQIEPTSIFGITISFLPKEVPPIINTPHFISSTHAICSYIFVPLFVVGFIWYLVCAQAYLARFWRIHILKREVFKKDLTK